jgi:hypothetical protein
MHTLKQRVGTSFDSTTITFDSSLITFDNNTSGTFFSFFPYRTVSSSSVSGVFKNERTREIKTLSLPIESGQKNTLIALISLSDFIIKDTYEFKLYSGSTEVYRGKLFAVFGNMQNYSVFQNENTP